MARPFVIGNWKMNTTIHQAVLLASAVRNSVSDVHGVEVVLCPPFVSLQEVASSLQGSDIKVGAQNMHQQDKGAFTGEVSGEMLKGIVTHVILGHSERRRDFDEADGLVSLKAQMALLSGFCPIVCVGESLSERKNGRAEEVISTSIKASLSGIGSDSDFIVAYEPVWAIGTGEAATADQAQDMCRLLRDCVSDVFDNETASRTPILYGGSVSPDNVAEFVSMTDIDGALVGGASLDAEQFASIVRTTALERVSSSS